MPSTHSLANKLAAKHHTFLFKVSGEFRWSPEEQTIFYQDNHEVSLLLHELAHALLGHTAYERDMELLGLERDAWAHASKVLAPQYEVVIDEDEIQEALDTYREWLHARSSCPNCQSTGIQTKKDTYRCLACHTLWRVNEAKACTLRRYTLTT